MTKRKENSPRGCLCKGRNVLCTDECRCVTNNKPCRNRVCMHLKLNTFTSFVIELPKSVRINLCILFRIRLSSRHLPMKAVEFEPSHLRKDGAVVRALASHQCGPGSIPRSGVKCGLSLFVLYSAPRGFVLELRFPLSSVFKI